MVKQISLIKLENDYASQLMRKQRDIIYFAADGSQAGLTAFN